MANDMVLTKKAPQPSASNYYKSWVAYDALTKAAKITSYKSVWNILACPCCPEPVCWKTLPVMELPVDLQSRIRWYDHVAASSSSSPLSATDLHRLRDHFVSHHQRIELILHALQPSLERIYTLMTTEVAKDKLLQTMTQDDAEAVIQECQYACNGWMAVTHLIQGVAKLDRIQYLHYVPSLAGVSGGNSPNMMALTHKTSTMESFFEALSDAELAQSILNRTPAGNVAEAMVDCLDALSRCWLDHVVTATTAIGITCGTKGTPNTILVDRALKRLYGSRLLKAIGSLRSPISGIGIEMRQLHDYDTYPLADHYITLFDDPGSEFGTHSIGYPPRVFDIAKREFAEVRRAKRTALWEHFYAETRPVFCGQLKRLLGIAQECDEIGFGLGSSVTEVLNRLIASVQLIVAPKLSVVLADDEFVTFQRAAALLGQGGANVCRFPSREFADFLSQPLSPAVILDEEKKEQDQVGRLVFVSLINSCTQRINPIDWAEHVPLNTVVVVDITQSIANIPLDLKALAARPNVFFIGSLIKHARCGEGIGFITYSRASNRLVAEPASGWTAYLSGLAENKTTVAGTNQLLYDNGLEWEGGTPSFVEAAYIATRVLQSLPPVDVQHDYVQAIKNAFLSRVTHLISDAQLAFLSKSNTTAIPVSRMVPDLPFGLDYKVVNGSTFLRIGFGIHNLDYHLDALVEVLERKDVLG